ncbi:MAG: hypothetical protein RMK52_04610 [Chitinophagales bacterium]|nr:hypothetical protein [Chitinophagales bacterium]MDW8393508.1 hypothetical protein [Chitinophagales bacterium]
MSLTFTWPWWYLVLLVVVASLLAFWLYYRDAHFAGLGRSFRPLWWLLAALRWLTVALVLFLLSSPLLRSTLTRLEKPVVVFLQDESQSVAFPTSADSAAYVAALGRLLSRLESSYTVRTFGFGAALTEPATFSFRQPATNLSAALQEIADRFSGQHLGAVILASDGIFNQGSNPVYVAEKLPVPVYTIALGDTSMRRDAAVLDVQTNRIAYLGNFFPVRVDLSAQDCLGESTVLSLYEVSEGGQQLVASQSVEFSSNSVHLTRQFILKASVAGTRHYRLVLQAVKGELTEVNNVREFFVEVQEKKQRILVLAPGPHPDIGAIRQALESTGNYQVEVLLDLARQPDWNQYLLVVLYQLPAIGEPASEALQALRRMNKPLLFVLGAQTSVSLFNQAQSLLTISGNNQSITEALPLLQPSFSLFTVPEAWREQFTAFPPLLTPFGDYRPAAGTSLLLKQKIGTVATEYPLLLFREDLNGRSAIICGEGLWRWRLWEYRQHQHHAVVDGLLSSVVQYLLAQREREPFRVWLQQGRSQQRTALVSESEPLQFMAELVNDAGEYINDPDVLITLVNQEGKEYPMTFNRDGNAYSLQAGFFPQGSYSWTARTEWNNRTYTASGRFLIAQVKQEFSNLRADHQLLYQISSSTGGQLIYPRQVEQLADTLQRSTALRPLLFSTTRTQPLINVRWLLALLLLLLAAEWVLRKYYGTY